MKTWQMAVRVSKLFIISKVTVNVFIPQWDKTINTTLSWKNICECLWSNDCTQSSRTPLLPKQFDDNKCLSLGLQTYGNREERSGLNDGCVRATHPSETSAA